MKCYVSLCIAPFVTLLAVPAASADPITVTSGHTTIAWDDPSFFELRGRGLHLTGLFVRPVNSPQEICFRGCAPGTRVDMNAVLGGPAAASLGLSFTTIVNGVNHKSAERSIWLTGDMQFRAASVTVPGLSDELLTLSAPFRFNGHISGFHPGVSPGSTTPLFRTDFVGQGTATLRMGAGDGVWVHPEVVYEFATEAPIPEPTTALLVGSGILGLLYRSRGRTSKRRCVDRKADVPRNL
jgi:hypothetical protein